MRIAPWLLVALAVPATQALGKPVVSPDTWLCLIGQFESADGGSMVEIENGAIAFGDTCPMTPAKVKRGRKRTVVSARWAGCQGLKGPVRVAVTVDTGSCDAADVRVRAPKAKATRRFHALRSKGRAADCQSGDTFAHIERRILGPRGCRVETCHGSAKSGGLDLTIGGAYDALVGATATGAPGDLRVVPGDSAKSFLVRKLAGVLAPGEGDPMPSVGRPLRPIELDLVRAWIDGGAPETGTVPGAPCPPPHRFEEAKPLPAPPGGYQIVYEGPT